MRSGLRRWLRFNGVGLMGVGVQLAMLFLMSRKGMPYLIATLLAVEASILHNFIWHERWTWAERRLEKAGILTRLWRFHLANGTISLAGNMILMWLFVGRLGWPTLPANFVAIVCCSVVNFFASDRWVFEA